MMIEPFRTIVLDNGHIVEFFDLSNRYFGNYNRAKIHALTTIPFDCNLLPDDLQQFAAGMDGCVTYETYLEQMAVPSDRLPIVIDSLIDRFLANSGRYLLKTKFAECLLRKKQSEQGF